MKLCLQALPNNVITMLGRAGAGSKGNNDLDNRFIS